MTDEAQERAMHAVVWAVVTSDGDVVGAYTNRVSAARRLDFLDGDERMKRFGPYRMVRCEGTIKEDG